MELFSFGIRSSSRLLGEEGYFSQWRRPEVLMWQPRNCDDSSEPQLVPRSFSSSPFQWLPHSLFNTSFHCSCWVCGICNNPAGFFVSLNVNTMFKFILPNYDVVNHKVAVSTPSSNLRYLHDILVSLLFTGLFLRNFLHVSTLGGNTTWTSRRKEVQVGKNLFSLLDGKPLGNNPPTMMDTLLWRCWYHSSLGIIELKRLFFHYGWLLTTLLFSSIQ